MTPLLVRARSIVPCAADVEQCGVTFEALGRFEDAALLIAEGRIVAMGSDAEITRSSPREARELDLRDCVVVPGLVDAHAHPLFAGDRTADFTARLRGETPPLGMAHTVACTRAALEDEEAFLRETILPRLRTIAAHGTTTLECKTGYALDARGELALLDLIARADTDADVPRLVATFLGAHALPPEFADESSYVDYLIDTTIPYARTRGAVYADAFCERGFFSVAQSRRYLEACRANGLRLRVHCDEVAFGQAAAMAADLVVDAVDHCNCIRDEDVRAISQAKIVTVACPATIAYLNLGSRVPARALLESGGDVALASDFNPGTSPCFNLQTVAYFGRALLGMSAGEALFGVTRAAARSLRVEAGSLRVGGIADLVALKMSSPEEFGWQFGGNLAALVVKGGVAIAGDACRTA